MEEDGAIRLIRNGDTIIVDPSKNLMQLDVTEDELATREAQHTPHIRTEKIIPMPLRQYARGNPNPRTGSLSIEF